MKEQPPYPSYPWLGRVSPGSLLHSENTDGASSSLFSVMDSANGSKGGNVKTRRRRMLIEQVPIGEVRKAVSASVSLIKTIDGSLFPRIEKMVLRVFRNQSSRDGFIRWLVKNGGVSEGRATLIADDQIAKAAEAMLRIKWKARGVKLVKWVHGSPNEPRKYHLTEWNGRSGANGRPNGLDGFVFPIDRPPVIDKKTGERGYPAQLIGCTCHLEPIKP